MNNRADKLIAEKLSSLDSLPEGYSPNVDAKWAIVQGSIDKKKTTNYKMWIGIAACLLILFLSTFYWKQLNSPSVVVEDHVKKKLQPVQNVTANKVVASKNEGQVETKSVIPFTQSTQQRKAGKSNESDVYTKDESAELNIPLLEESVHESEVAIVETREIKRKTRYVEVDFSDPVQAATKVAPSPFVKFKLGFNKDIFTQDHSVSNKPLRLHRNF